MRKYAILLVMMAFVVAFTSGCGLIVKDPEVDAQTVIIEVAGKTFAKAEVLQAIENVMDYQEYIYSLYGMRYDRTDAKSIANAQETALDSLIEEAVTDQKIREFGLDQFTDEEMAAISQTVDETYASYADAVKTRYFADTELTGEELDAAIDAKILEVGYSSLDVLLVQEKQAAALDKLRNMVVKDVSVTDEEVQAQYNTGVSNAITTYASTPTQYASDVNSGAIVYYVPSGYRYVKNLLIKISDEDQAALQSLSTQIADNQETLDATVAAMDELPADPAEDTDDQKQSRVELTAQSDTLSAEIQELTVQLNNLTETAYAAIQPTVDEVQEKIDAGENFDALVAEYGEDPGMMTEPQKSEGYLVCEGLTSFVDVFVNHAMALKKAGDISEPFRSSAGVHIVQYASDLEEGKAKFSAIRGQIEAELLKNKQDTLYDESINQWIADANAKVYADRLKD